MIVDCVNLLIHNMRSVYTVVIADGLGNSGHLSVQLQMLAACRLVQVLADTIRGLKRDKKSMNQCKGKEETKVCLVITA